MTSTAPLLEATEVVREYRSRTGPAIRALDGVSVAVPSGAFLVVTGPSGGGKTTLLSLLGALDRPTEGSVRFEGESLAGASEGERSRVRRRLGFVFQNSPMIPGLPVWENVTYPLVPLGASTRERRSLADQWLDRLGIGGRALARPGELSGGERRRVGVARALAMDPVALLADEPTSDLDPESADAVIRILRSRHSAGGTVVVVTHDPALRDLATEVCRLRAGRRED